MGCKASKDLPVEPTTKAAESSAPVLTEATAEERALLQLKLTFDSIDASDDGSVSKAELSAALDKDACLGALIKEAGLNTSFHVLDSLDTNKDGRVTWDEFHLHLKKAAVVKATGGLAAAEGPAAEKALVQLKKIFDSIIGASLQNGTVSKVELAAALKKDDQLEKLISEAGFGAKCNTFEQLDTNMDGRIMWQEFEAHLRTAAREVVKEDGDLSSAVVLDRVDAEGPLAPKSAWCC